MTEKPAPTIFTILVMLTFIVYACLAAFMGYVLYGTLSSEPQQKPKPPERLYDLTVCRFGESGEKCIIYRSVKLTGSGPLFVQFEHDGKHSLFSGNGYDFSAVEVAPHDTAAQDSATVAGTPRK